MFKLNYYEVDESVQEFLWQSRGTDRQTVADKTNSARFGGLGVRESQNAAAAGCSEVLIPNGAELRRS